MIAGASDTGKSFAFECINFGFGSSDVPELPPEADGYINITGVDGKKKIEPILFTAQP